MTLRACRLAALVWLTLATGVCAQADAGIGVRDYTDRTVQLDQPARRIVALSPHIVENLFALGLGARIVGALEYSDYPAAAKAIPRIGGFASISSEAIAALDPDLVIAWPSGNGDAVLNRLASLGITVYRDEPRSLADVARSLRDFAALAGAPAQGERLADDYLAQLESLRRAQQNKAPVTVFYQIWNTPLQTLNDKHIIGDVIRICGGRNIFGDEAALAPQVSIEAVLARNPQAIVASGIDEARPPWLDEWQRYPSLQAVAKGQLFYVPPDLLQRHTLRILQGAQQLCAQLDAVRD